MNVKLYLPVLVVRNHSPAVSESFRKRYLVVVRYGSTLVIHESLNDNCRLPDMYHAMSKLEDSFLISEPQATPDLQALAK